MSLPIDTQIGQYRIVEQIGVGGMATVYKAAQAKLDRHVAIKIMHQAFLQDPAFRSRFEREARIVAHLEHPNIVPIYDYDDLNGQPYLVMKLINGRTLKDMLKEGALSLEEIQRLIPRVADALTYAHSRGILHRDIKPSNIIIDEAGTPYLTDFGLARITQLGESTLSADMMLGTPHYISPEQAQGLGELDARTDVYSLGVILYELVTGRVPFTGETTYAIVHKHIYAAPPPPSRLNPEIPVQVETVLLRALEKDPNKRYDTPNILLQAFQQAVADSGLKKLDDSRVMTAAAVATKVPEITPGGGNYVSVPAPIERPNPLPGEQRLNEFFRQMGERVQQIANDIQRSEAWNNLATTVRENVHIEESGIKITRGDKPPIIIGKVVGSPDETERRRNKTQKLIAEDWGADETSIRRRVDKRIKERAGLVGHFIAYIIVNLLLIVLEPTLKETMISALQAAGTEATTAAATGPGPEALIPAVTAMPIALALFLPWTGGFIAHALAVFYNSGRRFEARRRDLHTTLVSRYGENWQETIDYKDYRRIRHRVTESYKQRLSFIQHAVTALFLTLASIAIWPAVQAAVGAFVTEGDPAREFVMNTNMPIIFMLVALFTVFIHGIALAVGLFAGDDARERAVERELERERERSIAVKAKRDESKLKNEDFQVRLNADGEFTESFVSEIEKEQNRLNRN